MKKAFFVLIMATMAPMLSGCDDDGFSITVGMCDFYFIERPCADIDL